MEIKSGFFRPVPSFPKVDHRWAKIRDMNKKGFGNYPETLVFTGADVGIRTPDLLITNQLLYQLSYIGLPSILKGNI